MLGEGEDQVWYREKLEPELLRRWMCRVFLTLKSRGHDESGFDILTRHSSSWYPEFQPFNYTKCPVASCTKCWVEGEVEVASYHALHLGIPLAVLGIKGKFL